MCRDRRVVVTTSLSQVTQIRRSSFRNSLTCIRYPPLFGVLLLHYQVFSTGKPSDRSSIWIVTIFFPSIFGVCYIFTCDKSYIRSSSRSHTFLEAHICCIFFFKLRSIDFSINCLLLANELREIIMREALGFDPEVPEDFCWPPMDYPTGIDDAESRPVHKISDLTKKYVGHVFFKVRISFACRSWLVIIIQIFSACLNFCYLKDECQLFSVARWSFHVCKSSLFIYWFLTNMWWNFSALKILILNQMNQSRKRMRKAGWYDPQYSMLKVCKTPVCEDYRLYDGWNLVCDRSALNGIEVLREN